MQNPSALTDEALLQGAADPAFLMTVLRQDPQRLAGIAETLLESPAAAATADAMMETNPKLFETPVAHAAERSTDPVARFRLWRAVFRRYPGRYREQVFKAGRHAMNLPDEEASVQVATWMTDKFGHEVVPELLDLMHRRDGQGQRIALLHEAVKVLGPGAVPVAEAALEAGFPELAEAARHALHALGSDPQE